VQKGVAWNGEKGTFGLTTGMTIVSLATRVTEQNPYLQNELLVGRGKKEQTTSLRRGLGDYREKVAIVRRKIGGSWGTSTNYRENRRE